MLRKILAVVAGYLVSVLWVMLTLSIGWLALGAGFAFEDGTTHTTIGWAAVMLVMGFIGAIIGGWLAALIARTPRAGVWLAVVMLVLGLGLPRPGRAAGVRGGLGGDRAGLVQLDHPAGRRDRRGDRRPLPRRPRRRLTAGRPTAAGYGAMSNRPSAPRCHQ